MRALLEWGFVLKATCLYVALSALACAAVTADKHSVTKHPATKHQVTKHQVTKHPATKHPATSHATKKPTRKSPKATAKGKSKTRSRSSQQVPTPERYQEIQQALASKGYFHGEPNGQWGPDSADALKRFQTDQNLTPDGKLGALSLIAMGLGPKRLSAQSSPPASIPK
ncbi:MAG: peptidoglycan-binding protein [Acidobacteriia bacterium]|nr:peptidoglycan-binding protein [Terriglobia bacterium]